MWKSSVCLTAVQHPPSWTCWAARCHWPKMTMTACHGTAIDGRTLAGTRRVVTGGEDHRVPVEPGRWQAGLPAAGAKAATPSQVGNPSMAWSALHGRLMADRSRVIAVVPNAPVSLSGKNAPAPTGQIEIASRLPYARPARSSILSTQRMSTSGNAMRLWEKHQNSASSPLQSAGPLR